MNFQARERFDFFLPSRRERSWEGEGEITVFFQSGYDPTEVGE